MYVCVCVCMRKWDNASTREQCGAAMWMYVYQLNSIASALLSTREYYIYIHTIYNSSLTLFLLFFQNKKEKNAQIKRDENLSAKLYF